MRGSPVLALMLPAKLPELPESLANEGVGGCSAEIVDFIADEVLNLGLGSLKPRRNAPGHRSLRLAFCNVEVRTRLNWARCDSSSSFDLRPQCGLYTFQEAQPAAAGEGDGGGNKRYVLATGGGDTAGAATTRGDTTDATTAGGAPTDAATADAATASTGGATASGDTTDAATAGAATAGGATAGAASTGGSIENPDSLPATDRSSSPHRQIGAQPRVSPEDTCLFFPAPQSVARLFLAVLCTVRRRIEAEIGRLPTEGEGFEAMLDHVIDVWGGYGRRLPAAHRVFERDRWRCTVPGCSSLMNLHDHHIVFRSAGGSDNLVNRTTLCVWHHLRGVHGGVVRCVGKAPSDLRFELGVRPGARPPLGFGPEERRARA